MKAILIGLLSRHGGRHHVCCSTMFNLYGLYCICSYDTRLFGSRFIMFSCIVETASREDSTGPVVAQTHQTWPVYGYLWIVDIQNPLQILIVKLGGVLFINSLHYGVQIIKLRHLVYSFLYPGCLDDTLWLVRATCGASNRRSVCFAPDCLG